MFIAVNPRYLRYTLFVLLMLSINIIDAAVTRSIADPERRLIVAVAASFDVVAVVSGLYYWLLVRPGIRAPKSLAVIALMGVLHATYFYPHAGTIRAVVGGLCEAALIGFVIVYVRGRSSQRESSRDTDLDPLESIRAALATVLMVPAIVNLITAELSILYYSLFSWRAKPHVPPGARAFSIYQRVGQAELFGLLPIACALEIAPVHLVLRQWNATVALAVTCLSVYSLIWLVGMARAFRLRPVLIARDYIHLRYGLLFQLRVPREMIARVRRAEPQDKKFAVPRKSEPKVCIDLVQVMNAEALFGIRRPISRVAVTPDDLLAFECALATLMDAV